MFLAFGIMLLAVAFVCLMPTFGVRAQIPEVGQDVDGGVYAWPFVTS